MAKKTITIEVSLFEAAMIKKLRIYEFGQFTINKMQGEPRRITMGGSEMLTEEEGLELEDKKENT